MADSAPDNQLDTAAERGDEIRQHWSKAAESARDDDGLRPTARDPHLQNVVDDIILKWLAPDQSVLDVGCGDGFSSLSFARKVARIVGIDYIADFVAAAEKSAKAAGLANTAFRQGDVRDLCAIRDEFGQFDVVTTTRCLINLPTAEQQVAAIGELAACVRPGGLYITSEGWSDGLDGLNVLRQRVGLATIPAAKFNLLMPRLLFEKTAERYFELVTYHETGLYLLLSRVVQPLLVKPDAPRHDHPLNGVAELLQRAGVGANLGMSDIDFSGVYVFRRR